MKTLADKKAMPPELPPLQAKKEKKEKRKREEKKEKEVNEGKKHKKAKLGDGHEDKGALPRLTMKIGGTSSPAPVIKTEDIPTPPGSPDEREEKRKKFKMSSKQQKSDESEPSSCKLITETILTETDSGDKIWICPACKKADDGSQPMIGCDGCDDWYHWGYVFISGSQILNSLFLQMRWNKGSAEGGRILVLQEMYFQTARD